MQDPDSSAEETARLGKEIYEREIRSLVEPEHYGEVVAIDIDSGGYEVAPDHLTAVQRARAKYPGGRLFALRVGFPALARIGGRYDVLSNVETVG
jgi:hypothetical protein